MPTIQTSRCMSTSSAQLIVTLSSRKVGANFYPSTTTSQSHSGSLWQLFKQNDAFEQKSKQP
jgi:hypothetical protein